MLALETDTQLSRLGLSLSRYLYLYHAAGPEQAAIQQPSCNKYSPNSTFLEQGGNKDRAKPWFSTASDFMSESDITIIQEWLHSGGPYTMYMEPARFLRLLLDEETGRSLNTMLLAK